jgi:four helix bundle protein
MRTKRAARVARVTLSARWVGMTDHANPARSLPHHKLIAYQAAIDLLLAVRQAHVRDAKLRDEATRAAKSTCLNCAKGASRVTRADKPRAFAIARGEAGEAAAAVEIAAVCGDASAEAAALCNARADRVIALLTRLVR